MLGQEVVRSAESGERVCRKFGRRRVQRDRGAKSKGAVRELPANATSGTQASVSVGIGEEPGKWSCGTRDPPDRFERL